MRKSLKRTLTFLWEDDIIYKLIRSAHKTDCEQR